MIHPSPERLNSSRSFRFRASRRSPVIAPSPVKRKQRMFDSGSWSASKSGAPNDAIVERSRRRAEVVVDRAEPLGAVTLERDPDLQDVHSPRALEAPRPLVPRAGGLAGVEEVGGTLREGGVEVPLVPDEDHARRERHEHHLVRVPGDRTGPLERLAAALGASPRRGPTLRGRRRRAARDRAPRRASRSTRGRRTSPSPSTPPSRRRPSRPVPAPPAGPARPREPPRPSECSRDGTPTALSVPSPIAPDGPRHGVVRVLAVDDDRRHRHRTLRSTRSAAPPPARPGAQ